MSGNLRDCLVVGGGPAGLTAAIYLARFHLGVTVIDAGHSRAGLIPLTRNHAGFPGGISGRDLLARMQEQASDFGVAILHDTVERLEQSSEGFIAEAGDGTFSARTVLLATGVVNHRPPLMDDETHDRALADGRLRYCPICDGYEVTDQNVAVIGTGQRGFKEAVFLRVFTRTIALFPPEGHHELSAEQLAALEEAGVAICENYERIRLTGDKIVLDTHGGPVAFDSLYPALGSDIRSELAAQLGASRSKDGCLKVDAHQRTSVPGLYAAGDVVQGLDQISHAMGEGGVAATTIRNDLAQRAPLRR